MGKIDVKIVLGLQLFILLYNASIFCKRQDLRASKILVYLYITCYKRYEREIARKCDARNEHYTQQITVQLA